MHRLNPAGLLLLGVDVVAPRHVEQIEALSRSMPTKRSPTSPCFATMSSGSGRDSVGITWPLLRPGCAPPRLRRLDDRDIDARLAQMQRGRKAGKTAADHDHIRLLRADQFGQFRPRRRHRGP